MRLLNVYAEKLENVTQKITKKAYFFSLERKVRRFTDQMPVIASIDRYLKEMGNSAVYFVQIAMLILHHQNQF